MKKLLLITMLAITACSNLEKTHPVVEGNRVIVHEYYIKKHGNDPLKWDAKTMRAWERDMNRAPAVTE